MIPRPRDLGLEAAPNPALQDIAALQGYRLKRKYRAGGSPGSCRGSCVCTSAGVIVALHDRMDFMAADNPGIIINPLSGAQGVDLRRLVEILCQNEVNWKMMVSSGGDDVPRLVDELAAEKCDSIGICGGDGTISTALPRLLHHDLPLLILAGGSANLLVIHPSRFQCILSACG